MKKTINKIANILFPEYSFATNNLLHNIIVIFIFYILNIAVIGLRTNMYNTYFEAVVILLLITIIILMALKHVNSVVGWGMFVMVVSVIGGLSMLLAGDFLTINIAFKLAVVFTILHLVFFSGILFDNRRKNKEVCK